MEAWWTEVEADEWSDAIVAAMKLGGVDELFFVSGSELTFYQEAIAKAHALGRPAPRLVTMTHENVALNAAIGNAAVRGQPAATAVHVDAGTLHMGAAIHTAWRCGAPVLMTSGAAPRAFPHSMRGARNVTVPYFQEPRDQGEIVRQYTKADHRLEHSDVPGLMVSRLLQLAMSEPRGPVHLTVPQECAMTELPGRTSFPTRDQLGLARPLWPDPDDAATVARWLIGAQRPLLLVGGAGREPAAVAELVNLAELLALPVAEGPAADRLSFPMTHWAYSTGPAAAEADVVVVMEEMAPFLPGVDGPAGEAKIAWFSSDPVYSRYKTREFRADLWIASSIAASARAIADAARRVLSPSDVRRIAARRATLEAERRRLDAEDERLAGEDFRSGRLTGRLVASELGRLLSPESIVCNDAITDTRHVQRYSKRTLPGTYFRSGSTSGGWGNGASIGIKLARPECDVVHVTGDGYFMFGSPLASLWAASHHRAAQLSVVLVNGSYSTGTANLRSAYPAGVAVRERNFDGGTFEPPPRFDLLAAAANASGEEVREVAGLAPALRRGLELTREGVPAVVAVRLAPLA